MANHRTPRRIAASIFDAESLDSTPMPVNPYRRLEATAADFGTVQWNTNFYVTGFDAGRYFVVKGLDLSAGLSEIRMALASTTGSGRIAIRDGSTNGLLLATLTPTATGGSLHFQEQAVPVRSLSGLHDLYFVSQSPAAATVD